MRILPLSTINDNRTILQEVLRVRKYLEENPCRNVFHIDADYDENTVAYDLSKVFIPLDFDGDVNGGDVIIFKNAFIAVLDTVSTDYVIIKADTAVSIKGDKGDTGATGATGNGISAIVKTGTSGLVDTYTITFTNGTTSTFTVTNGKDGENGTDGNGIASIAKTGTSGLVDTYTITFTNGTTTTFTVTNGANGQGIPTGGGTGKVLQKVSDADYDTQWATVVGIPVGGTTGQVLKKTGNANYAVEWANESGGGGTQKTLQFTDNLLINHNFLINQRGTTTYSKTGYTVDRWYFNPDASGTFYRRTDYNNSAILYKGAIKQLNKFGHRVKGYLLAIVQYQYGSVGYGTPTIDVSIAGVNQTAINSGSITNESTMQKWAIYEVDADALTNFGFIINSDEAKETYLQDSALYLLNDLPSIDQNTYFNIYDEGVSIQLEKCKYYYEKPELLNVSEYNQDTPSKAYYRGYIGKKRITPTFSISSFTYKYWANGTNGESTKITDASSSMLSSNKYEIYGGIGKVSTMYASIGISGDAEFDAEIYP